ncbi:MAG: hypothetical protein MJ211_15670 [Bacteroidales bacterium]|nr:hypothetical protein [Bacteroidales bacterium]
MNCNLRICITILLIISALDIKAQRFFFQQSKHYDIEMQSILAKDTNCTMSNLKPVYILSEKYKFVPDSQKLSFRQWIVRHLFNDDFLKFHGNYFNLTINPIAHFEINFQKDENPRKNYYTNTRGFELFGKLGKRIYFYSDFYENQAFLPHYQDSIVKYLGVMPGMGVAKAYQDSGWDWAFSDAMLMVEINKNFKITLANGKNFIGSGYNSTILSYNAFNYPYLRYDLKFGNFYYTIINAIMQSKGFGFEFYENRHYKYSSYYIASYKPNPKFEFSIIEGVMWKNTDDNGKYSTKPKFDIFLPIIFYPTIKYGFNGETNTMIGYDINYTFLKNVKLYHQLNWNGKNSNFYNKYYGYQIGIHIFDVLFNKLQNTTLHLQYEYTKNNRENGIKETDFYHHANSLTTNDNFDELDEQYYQANINYKRFKVETEIIKYPKSINKNLTFRYFLNKITKWNIYGGIYQQEYFNKETKIANTYLYGGISIYPSRF